MDNLLANRMQCSWRATFTWMRPIWLSSASGRGDQNRFGVALQLGCVRFPGTFLTDPSRVPANAQWFVARQLGITDIAILSRYAQRETTRREHTAQIRTQYQYREFMWPWSFRLSRLLYTRSWISNERPSLLFDRAPRQSSASA